MLHIKCQQWVLFTGPNERLIQNATTGVMLTVLTLFSIIVALALIWIKVLKLPKGFHQSLLSPSSQKGVFPAKRIYQERESHFQWHPFSHGQQYTGMFSLRTSNLHARPCDLEGRWCQRFTCQEWVLALEATQCFNQLCVHTYVKFFSLSKKGMALPGCSPGFWSLSPWMPSSGCLSRFVNRNF